MESTETQITLASIPLGGRLLVRSKKDWRTAVVSRITEDQITISVASPSGHCYRLRRALDATIAFDGRIPFLVIEDSDTWRDNFSQYDVRW
ncbi:MAG: hypothetical protein ABIO91_07050 [Pyrinomonadaceae bacterium]